MSTFQHPFHRLLSFFARQGRLSNSTNATTRNTSTTIRFIDSVRGDLALGFNFPLSVLISLTRHLIFRTGPGSLSLSVHIPSVKLDRKLLGGPGKFPSILSDKRYSLSEIEKLVRNDGGSLKDQLDALGIWTMAAERKDGRISGKDLRAFQEGSVLEDIAKRRRGRDDILPFGEVVLYREQSLPSYSGLSLTLPYSVAGHSWAVKRLLDVDVYRKD